MGNLSIFRHREVRLFSCVLVVLALTLIVAGLLVSPATAVMAIAASLLFAASFFWFTLQRYRAIRELSDYLRRISAGEPSLDMRDNEEGELSILKSEIYKVTQILTEYNRHLQHEKLLLADQLADISHQLKTPLTSMLMMVDLLRNEQLPQDKRREFTGHLRTQLERIEWLVSSLLKMSKLDAGVIEMKREQVSAGTLLDLALRPLLIPLEVKEIDFSLGGGEQVLLCDLQWTAEALLNILKNCIEHTPSGGSLAVTVTDNPLFHEIEIADSGIGIAKQDLPYIFRRFYRGQNAAPDSIGIGLAMSRSIMRRQNGEITVESRPGEGTTFHVRFYKSVV